MNINQMRAFQELMITGSVSQAARNLHRTQPSVSAAIASLEGTLGMPLFDRTGGRLRPVAEAHYLFDECRQLLSRLDQVSQNMQRLRDNQQGELSIVSMPGPSVFVLPELIARFTGVNPEIRTNLQAHSTSTVIRLVGSQQFDLGIADYRPNLTTEAQQIDVRTIRYQCLCALPAAHPLASEPVVQLSQLSDVRLATLRDDHPVTQQLHHLAQAQAVNLTTVFKTQYFIPLLTFVEKGAACAIVDPVTVRSYGLYRGGPDSPVVFRPMAPAIDYEIAILTPKYRPLSQLGRTFAAQMVKEFEGMATESGDAS